MQAQPFQPAVEEVIDTASKPIEQAFGKKPKKNGGNKGMNRKALKNLIQAELQNQSKDIFREILKAPIEGVEESKEPASLATKPVVHQVTCDGCDTSPITGIRYKCSVCKDFDYCANCEERLAHEHPFLKIKDAASVPDVMITILPELFEAEDKSQPQGEQQPFGFGGRGGRCGRGGRGGFKRMVGQFLEQMGLNLEDVTKKFQGFQAEGASEDMCGWAKKDWKLKRVEVVSFPQHVLEAVPGQMLLPTIELKNGTHWPWKAGCVLTLAKEAAEGFENLPIETVHVPITQPVAGKGTIKLTVPLKVHDYALGNDTVHEIKLAMQGPGGMQFGNVVTLKLKVMIPSEFQDEAKIYKLALQLSEQGLGSFDECVEAVKSVKDANYDEQAAIKALQRK